jgi:hypothetical protein
VSKITPLPRNAPLDEVPAELERLFGKAG